MNKLAKSKSIADISQKGLNLSKLSGLGDVQSNQYASTARHDPKGNQEAAANPGNADEPDGIKEAALNSEQKLASQRALDDVKHQKERERLLNKSQSLSKGTMGGGQRFNATSYIRAKQRGQNLSLGFDAVKGLRNRSFLAKDRVAGAGEDPQSSARRKPVHIHPRQIKRYDVSHLRDGSNPKNLSINSRMYNPRPLNNLSKNMSLQDEQIAEAFGLVPQMQTEVIKERGLDGSQYENVSMGSIGSFEAAKPQSRDKLNEIANETDNKEALIPAYINSSPSKATRQPVGSFKHPNKGTWETNFYTQTIEGKASSRRLEINTGKMMRAPVSGLKRAPLTSKYAQGTKATKHKKQSTTEFEFLRKHAAKDHDGTSKISAISPLKVERAQYMVKNKVGVASKLGNASDPAKMWRTHRASQNVAAISLHAKMPSQQLARVTQQQDQSAEPLSAESGPTQDPSSAKPAALVDPSDLKKQEMEPNQVAAYSFTNLPSTKRYNRQVTRPKNHEQGPKILSPHLAIDDGRHQKSAKPYKLSSPAFGGMSPLTPVAVKYDHLMGTGKMTQSTRFKKAEAGVLVDKSYQKLAKPYQPPRKIRENKSVKNLASGPKEHKRSMTLATREAMKEQVADAFQSIIEEPAEDNNKSNENKSREDLIRETSSAPRFAKDSSQGQQHLQATHSRNRGSSHAKEKDHSGRQKNREFQQANVKQKGNLKMPRGSMNVKSEQIQNNNSNSNNKNSVQVQQQYGLINNPAQLNAMNLKFKTGVQSTSKKDGGKQNQSNIEGLDISRNENNGPQHTRTRSFLRTTRNTIAQHGPKQGLSIPEPLSMSTRYAQYQNNSKKAVDRNLTFLQEFKKSNQTSVKGANNTSKTSQRRPISTSKPQSTQVTARGIPHLPIGPKFGSKLMNAAESELENQKTQSARRRVTNLSKERISNNEIYKKTGSQKKSLTSKKSVNTSSKIELLEEKLKVKQPQINNLMMDEFKQPEQTRNNLQVKNKTSNKSIDKNYPSGQNSNITSTEDGIKKVAIVVSGKTMHQSNTNPQQPSSSLSGMLGSKSQMTTSRSPRKEEMSVEPQQPEFPMSSDDALNYFGNVLNDYEKQEILDYSGSIYYLGQKCKNKVKGHVVKMVANTASTKRSSKDRRTSNLSNTANWQPMIPSQRQIERLQQMDIYNYGYDDENGDYQTVLKDHIGYRYEIVEALGSGSFGQALKCLDHSTGKELAVKIIRNKKKFQYQAGMELKILLYLNKHDKQDQNNVIRVKDFMLFREHLIIAFELLSINLYEFIKNNNFQGVSQNLIRRFAIQILQALKYHHDHFLVHCDLKPENILLKQENKSGIKVIDYGSSCFMGQRIYTYIQSRFYRAPEIILGIPYTTAIDMWSFGAIVAELYTGFPLFPGESEMEQLAYIMELYGIPPENVLKISQRRDIFFTKDFVPKLQPNSRGKVRHPNQKKLEDILRCNDEFFLDFLNKCFIWDPVKRMTALEALQHPWILEGLPEKVLKHHKKMFGYKDDKAKMRQMTHTEIQGFPKDKKDQSIYDILNDIREEQNKEKQILLAKSRLESSRNNLTRQTFKTSERDRTSRAEEGAQHIRSEKSLRSQLNNQGQPPSLEVAEIHLQTNKMAQTQLVKVPHNYKATNQSPNKERKSRKQRMENSELKLIHKLAQFQNFDQKGQVEFDQPQDKPSKRKSTSIKVYKPECEPVEEDMDQHYMNKLAVIKDQFEKGVKKPKDLDINAIVDPDNSMSQVRDEQDLKQNIKTIQTNILNSKSQVTEEITNEDTSENKLKVGGQVYSQTIINTQSQASQMLQKTSSHYKPKRKSQQKFTNNVQYDNTTKFGQDSQMHALSSLPPESLVAENQKNKNQMNRQASSKNALAIQSVAVEEQDDSQEQQDMTPLQFKYSKQ